MPKKSLFFGTGTALVTPFSDDGALDIPSLCSLIEYNLTNQISAIAVLGTTGEPSTLTDEERDTVIRESVRAVGGAVPVIVGVGSSSTLRSEKYAMRAQELGADALLAVTPYYSKATERGLIEHYGRIARSTSLPVIAYTVPSRTGMSIPPHLWGELFSIPNLVGLKDATADVLHAATFISSLGREVSLWSGCDELTLPLLSVGAEGSISVLSNILPDECRRLVALHRDGKNGEAAALSATLLPLCRALFCEVNPVPVKAALSLMGLASAHCRLPLTRASESTFLRLDSLLRAYKREA